MRCPPTMTATLCLVGGCNGAGKTTLARELLPRLGIMRLLNPDEVARGLSPLDPSLAAFKAGRLVLEETKSLIRAGESFAIESTLSGKTHVAMLRAARERGFRIVIHYVAIASAQQAVERIRLRVKLGGHNVPADDVERRYNRSLSHLVDEYLPLADGWSVWDNRLPPAVEVASHLTQTVQGLKRFLTSTTVMEKNPDIPSDMSAIVAEASRVATEKMLDYYKRMGIRVTPEMTLAPEPKRRRRKKSASPN